MKEPILDNITEVKIVVKFYMDVFEMGNENFLSVKKSRYNLRKEVINGNGLV